MSLGPVVFDELVLASTSPARRALLDGLGLPYVVVAPEVDEVVAPGTPASHAVAILAERKARAVYAKKPRGLIIGSDQLASMAGQVLGKPPDARAAKAQLTSMVGKTHELFTGLCVIANGFLVTEVDVARLTMFPIDDRELEGYVATGEWQGCAGSYRIEGRGQSLFSRIEGDRAAIRGLPMQRLVRILREAGVFSNGGTT
ncbi:MAG: Maf family protein [Myxococcaceae bacterium]